MSGMQTVLPVLLERHGDVRGELSTQVVAMTLLELLRGRHPLLMALMVRGVGGGGDEVGGALCTFHSSALIRKVEGQANDEHTRHKRRSARGYILRK